MSPLETPVFVGLAVVLAVLGTVVVIWTERRHTVRRNRAAQARGYVR